jgi:predicted Zn-dependent protease with MMP-like domain
MLSITDDQFAEMIADAIETLPPEHLKAVRNVAFVYDDDPTPEQRQKLRLQCNQTLFGLYEGVPLTRRGGMTGFPPDKITIFKNPILNYIQNEIELKKHIRHTVWHEVAHYFGLNHEQIHALENKHN